MEAEIMKVKKLEATAMFAGGIAHDFNNFLTVILGNLDLAQEERMGDRSIAKQLQGAREACLSAAELTKKFLTFSLGGAPFKKLAAVEELLTEAANHALAGSSVHPEYSFPEGLWPVEVDIDQIILAIGNVLTNARESMPQGGVIRIRADNVDSLPGKSRKFLNGQTMKYVKVSIEDGGQGIAKDILPQVFDPYFTSKNTWQKKGLGLGLTVSYSIIKKHGGIIDIASKQNIGTTVSIYLPANAKQLVPQESKPPRVFPLNKKILLMDDEEMLRKVSGNLLEALGYEVELAGDGEEAIQIYVKAQQAGSPFGAVILDLTVKGGMGGKETIRRLKELDPEVRAIVVSGYADDPIMSNCEAYGFLVALPKPFQLKDLQEILRSIFSAAVNPVQS
jgi:CheY-like chemotaxis protein